MLTPVIDTSKEYGLVLEGGGAKGAYQIGAWICFHAFRCRYLFSRPAWYSQLYDAPFV